MINIVVGMVLLCPYQVNVGENSAYIKDVPTTVLYTNKKQSTVEYNFSGIKTIKVSGENKITELVGTEELSNSCDKPSNYAE